MVFIIVSALVLSVLISCVVAGLLSWLFRVCVLVMVNRVSLYVPTVG